MAATESTWALVIPSSHFNGKECLMNVNLKNNMASRKTILSEKVADQNGEIMPLPALDVLISMFIKCYIFIKRGSSWRLVCEFSSAVGIWWGLPVIKRFQNTSLFRSDGCGSTTDKDWTVTTWDKQVLRQQVVVMMLVRYEQRSTKKKSASLLYRSKVLATTEN